MDQNHKHLLEPMWSESFTKFMKTGESSRSNNASIAKGI